MASPAAGGVMGVFAHVDTTVQAIRELRSRGFRVTTYSPLPLEELEEAITGHGLPRSPVRLFTLVGGLTGTASGFALTLWTSLKWNIVVGGKPIVSIPPYVVIAFELTILLGGLCTLLALFLTGPLPLLRGSPRFDPRFTADRFGVEVHCPPDQQGVVQDVLRRAGAEEVRA
jgi:molybdopterin-containing oxidoreductase family membrane subunit